MTIPAADSEAVLGVASAEGLEVASVAEILAADLPVVEATVVDFPVAEGIAEAAGIAAAEVRAEVGEPTDTMKPILTPEEEESLVAAIREQELRTSAEIRVCVTYKLIWQPERHAWDLFEKIGMRQTRHRNGTLIVMMPRMKRVVVLGDSGVDATVPPDFWKLTVDAMIRQMHDASPLDALREGLGRVGDQLSIHWPFEEGDLNELPDTILKD